MAKYRLVSFKTCPWVQRVAILLREKKIDFEFQHIEPDNRPDWFRAISPHNKVPVLCLDDRVPLFESGAIADTSTRRPRRGCIPRIRSSGPSTAPGSKYLPTFVDLASAHAYSDIEADFNTLREARKGAGTPG